MNQEKTITRWIIHNDFESSIELSDAEIASFIATQENVIREDLTIAWNGFLKRVRYKREREQEAYNKAIVDMCNTPYSTYWQQHFE